MEATIGAMARKIQAFLDEHFNPGAPVAILIGVDRDLDQDSLNELKTRLAQDGLIARVEFGTTPQWENALRFQFRKPSRRDKTLKVPLAELLTEGLTAAGINTIKGVQVVP